MFYSFSQDMAYQKGKHTKNISLDQQKSPEKESAKKGISDAFLDELQGAFSKFDKVSETERVRLYGNKEYLEQFRDFFSKNHPNLLDKIDKKDLPVYIKAIEHTGFSLPNIIKNASKLNEEFKSEDTEIHVMQQSLSQLKTFCDEKTNNIPVGTFKKFADFAKFSHDKLVISPDGSLKNIDTLLSTWNSFVEKEGIVLGKTPVAAIERFLTPHYSPLERMMVTVAINKIRKQLKGKMQADFDAQFPLPIDIFTSYQDLLLFRDAWQQFLFDHSPQIDESLAKKLDSIVITNGDIQGQIRASGRTFDDTRGFSEQEQYFRHIFNKLVTRQLFEEVKEKQTNIEHYLQSIGNTFKQFPPYLDQILVKYPFNAKHIAPLDPSYLSDVQTFDDDLVDLDNRILTAHEDEKKKLREKKKEIVQKKEKRRWQAYIAFLKTKDASLADVFGDLVNSGFDFSLLSTEKQQHIVNTLVATTLEDTIKNKIPELLSVDESEISQFIHDFFDLKKMNLTIPTRQGPVPLTFVKKEFLSQIRKQPLSLNDLENFGQLPLNFITQLTESNAPFFEESPIFDSIYTDFSAQNGKFRLNDGYKVQIIKDGKTVQGYLSAYAPLDKTAENYPGKELYLYSEPISFPSQERSLVTRPDAEGKPSNIPVIIKEDEQTSCGLEILDKKIHLNGDSMGALLFGYVLGQQSMNMAITPEQEKKLAEQLGSLAVYQDKETEKEDENFVAPEEASPSASVETPESAFMAKWKQLPGYAFLEEKYKNDQGFAVGTRLFMPFSDSGVPPESTGKSWLQMKIVDIDKKKGTFTIKTYGGEFSLGKSEGATKELPMSAAGIDSIKAAFGDKIYKMPDSSAMGFEAQMHALMGSVSGLEKSFGSVKAEGSSLKYALGNYTGKEITHFGIYQPRAMDEAEDQETGTTILYKTKYNAHGTVTVSADSTQGNQAKHFPTREMDYLTFMLFIKEKGLQPKCKEQMDTIHTKVAKDDAVPRTVRGFSINNMLSFFKNSVNKITDGMKKYDEEGAEELTDILTSKGKLWGKVGGILSPFGRVSSSFETMGMEYYMERDTRIWKKVDKWVKFYEDYDYTDLYNQFIGPMLKGEMKITPHYKIAAMLLVHLKKGKGPYAKNLPPTEGLRIGKLLGKEHQERYLAMREKKIRDLEENAHIYGGPWADQIKNELVDLEMKYIVHVMDGRKMGIQDQDKTKYFFQEKYSKKFCDELEGAYTGFYKQDGVNEGFTKNQDANFEFARNEYFRQLADRPQQALPFLKVMATKAINETQWQVFEAAVLAGILSGVFLNMTYSSTQKFIQTICRTRGFIPGIFAKDIKQQTKIQRLLDLFSGGAFSKETGYSPSDYSFRTNKSPGKFITAFQERTDKTIVTGTGTGSIRAKLSKFLSLTGDNVDKKTILDLHSDPDLSMADKLLLDEYIAKTNEKNESLDNDVVNNTSSLTGSILTKSQSVVNQMIKIDAYGFAGKDGDEKENMKSFSEEMEKTIPGDVLSQQQTEFFLGKFFNRFGGMFSGAKKTELLKRLYRCKNNPNSPEVDSILYYGIVGEIINALSPRDVNPPDELLGALGAWKTFFKNNLHTVLRTDVVNSTFGHAYSFDTAVQTPKLDPWQTASLLLDKFDGNMYINGLPTDDLRKQARLKKRELQQSNSPYINGSLYKLADELSRKTSAFPNLFNRANAYTPSVSAKPIKTTGAKIKTTTEVMENVRKILEGKPLEQTPPDQYDPTMYPDYEDYDID